MSRKITARSSLAALLLLTPTLASAQETAEPAAAPDKTEAAKADAPLVPQSDVAKLAADLEEQKKALADQQKTIEDLQQKVDTAAATEGDNDWTNRFKIYGFTDVGLNRVWVNEKSGLGNFANSANATSFVVGNLNMYFDAQPVKGWRSLVEMRLTSAPNGEIQSAGGLAGTFKRTSTMQNDPNASSLQSTMWGSYVVIERAHLDWTDLQYLKVRVGSFFTPFGIWNVDHGSPTLISTQLPSAIQLRQMPLRQTGIQIYGSTFSGGWELGYNATVTNGRQELSNFAFDDNRGFGARLYANSEKGDVTMKFGASVYTGRVKDQEIDVTSVTPLSYQRKSNYNYREVVGGLDASIDVGRTRIRTEGALSTVRYDDGQHEVAQDQQSFKPSSNMVTGYVMVAHQLPWIPVEPYLMVDSLHGVVGAGDMIIAPSAGINVRFTKAVILKTQISRAYLLDLRGRGDASAIGQNDATELFSRLVLVF